MLEEIEVELFTEYSNYTKCPHLIPEPLMQQPSLETCSQALFEEQHRRHQLQNTTAAAVSCVLLTVLCPATPCVMLSAHLHGSPAVPPRSRTRHHFL